jgi:hypothetical protein
VRCRFIAFHTPEVAHYALPNIDLIRQYCRKWGHELTIEDDTSKIFPSLQGRAIFWAYFPLLERFWNEPGIDWFVKLDLDCRIVDQDYDITRLMTDDVDLIYATDIGPDRINAGVQLIRNCDDCRGFYGRVWRAGETVARGRFKNEVFHEQTILSAAIDFHASLRPRIEIYPHDAPHSFNDFAIHSTTFVLHDLKKGADPMGCRCRLHDVPAAAPAKESLKISPTAPIRVVYFCYLVNNWRQLMHEQLLQLVTSGLAKNCSEIWLVTCGAEDDGTEAQQLAGSFIPSERLKTHHQTGNQFELPGINKVYELANAGECKILYFHSKGVSNQFVDFQGTQVSERKVAGASDWRAFMAHFLIDRWQDCVELLNSNDVVAAFINPDNNWPHGNFWWTTSAHAKTCAKPSGSSDRWSHEAWLTTKGRPGKYHSFTSNEWDFHVSDHPRWLYDGSALNRHLRIVSASYGSPTVQIDEGRPPTPAPVTRHDVTDAVIEQVQDERALNFVVDNRLYGDPCFGIKKVLSLVWSTVEDPDVHYILDQDEGQRVKLELP